MAVSCTAHLALSSPTPLDSGRPSLDVHDDVPPNIDTNQKQGYSCIHILHALLRKRPPAIDTTRPRTELVVAGLVLAAVVRERPVDILLEAREEVVVVVLGLPAQCL